MSDDKVQDVSKLSGKNFPKSFQKLKLYNNKLMKVMRISQHLLYYLSMIDHVICKIIIYLSFAEPFAKKI